MSDIENKVVALAVTQLGVKEATGHNDGEIVGMYQSAVNLGMGAEWCCCFVMWLLKKSGVKGWPVTGYVPTVADWAADHGVLKSTPQVGAWSIYYDQIGPYHIGIVERVNSDGTFDVGGFATQNSGDVEVTARTRGTLSEAGKVTAEAEAYGSGRVNDVSIHCIATYEISGEKR